MIVGIGVDVESIESFRTKKPTKHRKLYERIFSKKEIEYCQKFKDASPRFTARFCAKEAAIKAAHPVCSLYISDVEVLHLKNGAPTLVPRSKRTEVKKLFKNHQIHLSLSHTDNVAIAMVVIETKKGR